MAFVAADSTSEPRAFSLGPLKMQILTYSAASGDTSGTLVADKLANITHVIIDGLIQTSLPTITGNSAALAFAAVGAAGVVGSLIVLGN